jgi:hypothetical protein
MKRYVIEREIPGVGQMDQDTLRAAAAKSNEALAKLGSRVQWLETFLAQDKTFCIYLAEDEAAIREHAELSGFPASRINEVMGAIDPTTGRA